MKKFKLLVFGLSFWLIIQPITPLLAGDADLFTTRVEPDVMIIFDSSGSMTFDVWHDEPPSPWWRYYCTYPYSLYFTWGDGSEEFPGVDTNGDGLPNDSRMYNLKAALRLVLQQTSGLRFALATYGQKRGRYFGDWYWVPSYCARPRWQALVHWNGYYWPYSYPGPSNIHVLRVPFGEGPEHLNRILRWIDNHDQSGYTEIRADGGTPIGGTLYWVRKYYQRQVIRNDIARDCRRYFVLLVTDGEANGYLNGNPHNPWQEIQRLRHVRVRGKTHDIRTFVIGIGIPGSQQLQQFAELGGTHRYYPATNPEEMVEALRHVFGQIIEQAYAFSSPEVPSVATRYQNTLYFSSFIPSYDPLWRGYLRAYRLNPDGTIPVDEEGHPAISPMWDAGVALQHTPSHARNIYTVLNSNLVPFQALDILAPYLEVPSDSVATVVNYVRGENPYNWKLGDIFHSAPVLISGPSPYFQDEGFSGYRNRYRTRNRIVVVGSNDGMLHAFDAGSYSAPGDTFTTGTGTEVWAFIPPDLLPKLKKTLYTHEYMVDGSPVVADVWFKGSSPDIHKDPNEWHTVLVCGERDGGRAYFALDVTNTYDPLYLWSFSDADLGYTWSKPAVGRTHVYDETNRGETWFVAFGGGMPDIGDNLHGGWFTTAGNGGLGASFYIVDIENGQTIWKMRYSDGKPNSEHLTHPVPGTAVAVDITADGYADRIYFGDARGQLWRVDISSINPADWVATPIFRTNTPAPIFYPPAVTVDEEGNLRLYFGTGDRANPRDTLYTGAIYCVVDRDQTSPVTEDMLGNVSHGGGANEWGWKYYLGQHGRKGEKVVTEPDVFANLVFVSTYRPIYSPNPCELPGESYLYVFEYISGNKVSERLVGSGLPTSPQITVTESGEPVLTLTTSTGEVLSEKLPSIGPFKQMLLWREITPKEQ